MCREQVSQARLREDEEEEEVTPQNAGNAAAGPRPGGGSAGAGGAAGGAARGTGDGFTVTDAPQEMDVNLEYKELAREGAFVGISVGSARLRLAVG